MKLNRLNEGLGFKDPFDDGPQELGDVDPSKSSAKSLRPRLVKLGGKCYDCGLFLRNHKANCPKVTGKKFESSDIWPNLRSDI